MSWEECRIEHLADEVRDTVDPGAFGDAEVDHYSIPALDATGKPETQPASQIQSHKQWLRGGEVLLSRLNPRKARVLRVPPLTDRVALASSEFVVLRPHSVTPRFLEYVLLSEGTRQTLDGAVQSVTRSHQRIRPEQLLKLRVTVPIERRRQRAIADFLDNETARIDTLITKKRRMIDLLWTKLDAERSRCLWGGLPTVVPLMYLTPPNRQVMYGIVLPGPDVDDGVPIVKGGDVAAGLTRRLCRTTREIESGFRRSRLQQGDLVFAIRGGIGDVAMVPTEVAGANITQDVARVAPGGNVEARWLLHVLKSPEVQRQAQMRTTGATIHGLNIWELKRLRLPDRDGQQQRAEAVRLDRVEDRIEGLASSLGHQISLLQEHRQALITAAATGELEVPGVAP